MTHTCKIVVVRVALMVGGACLLALLLRVLRWA